jgi:hypothetical protein
VIHVIDLDISSDDTEIVPLILVYLVGESIRMFITSTNFDDLTMTDHHIESVACWYWPFEFITHGWIFLLSFLRHLEAEKTRSLARMEILDHADTELVPIFLVDGRLDKFFSFLRISYLDPLRMIRIDDELAFDFYISRHRSSIAIVSEKCKYLFPFASYPVLRLYIYSIRSDLPDLTSLETVSSETTTEATPSIDTDSISTYT